jgi:iron complex transport system substrate-binding protein
VKSLLVCLLLLLAGGAHAAGIVDATGRSIDVPDQVMRVLPAGRPAAVLLAALAPDLMLGWPQSPSPDAAAWLPDTVAALPQIPPVSGDRAAIIALHPDLIVDYGTVNDRYIALAKGTQDATGIATLLLDGHLAKLPEVLRGLGQVLHREARAEVLARLAEATLAAADGGHAALRAVYVRGAQGTEVAVPGSDAAEVPELLGWKVLAPAAAADEHHGFRPATLAQIAALDADVLLFASPAMRQTVAQSPDWRALRAVREGHAWIVPASPFGWLAEPPSINRLLGLAWLGAGTDADVLPYAAVFHALVYGRTPTPEQLANLRDALRPIEP